MLTGVSTLSDCHYKELFVKFGTTLALGLIMSSLECEASINELAFRSRTTKQSRL
jgi:hypothetical protein